MKSSSTTAILHLLVLFGEALAKNLIQSMAGEGITDRGLMSQVLDAAPPNGHILNLGGFTITCESFHPGNECDKMIDGDQGTFYHSEFPDANPLPHVIIIDMGRTRIVNGIAMLPRQDGGINGIICGHSIDISEDGQNFETVAHGTWFADATEKFAVFEAKLARYIRIAHKTEPNNQPFTSCAEIGVFTTSSFTRPQPSLGIWAETLDFPIVPTAAAVLHDGKVMMWSSYAKDAFTGGQGGFTFTATYDPATGTISQRTVTNTHHDMFCPGVSIDANGRVVVTGGNDAFRTSIYDPAVDAWIAGPDMSTSRGYQASATCSDGRIFVMGGSWSGGVGNKNGEIYDPATNTWTPLPQCSVQPMLTDDKQGTYRADNHAMLFGWKGNSVFHAGPSKAMNWYTTTGAGGHKSAGTRGKDSDAMCGIAVMYDAVSGKILVAGGSSDYLDTAATNNAHIITIGNPNTNPSVQEIAGMNFKRIFHNSVVLPSGDVFIVGGQTHGKPFMDDGYRNTSEIFSLKSGRFQTAAVNSIARNYHSLALLLQDATVISCGGGLCGKCTTNHFDCQMYHPAYLFNSDGSKATRPVVTSISSTTVRPGGRLNIKADSKIASMSLIRLGSATHTVNTDQRRIPLDPRTVGTNAYNVLLPADYGILLPGYYFLFAMNARGVPSIGITVKVT